MVCAGFTSGAVCRVEVESEVKTFDENAVTLLRNRRLEAV
jgi:hypothetical protein